MDAEKIDVNQYGIELTFKRINSTEWYADSLQVRSADFHDMIKTDYGKSIKVYDGYKDAMAEVKRLNAAERGTMPKKSYPRVAKEKNG